MNRNEIEKLKIAATNSITRLLDHLGVRYADCGSYFKATCPAKNHDGDRDNQSAFCWFCDTRTWACFSHNCNVDTGSDVVGLIMAVKELDFKESLQWLKDFLSNHLGVSEQDLLNLAVDPNVKKEVSNHRIHEGRLKFLRRDEDGLAFLLKRGFSIEVLEKFDVGFWSRLGSFMHDRIVIPVRDYDGFIVGFTGRTIWPEDEWKKHGVNEKWRHGSDYVQYLKGSFHKSAIVFNLNNAKNHLGEDNSIFIVEGPCDGFKLSMAGIENWIACLGSYFSTNQRSLLIKAGVSKVKLAFDNDNAGQIASKKLKENLSQYFHVQEVELPEGCDPGDLDVSQVKEIFNV